jgi:hypothetical protein
MTYNNKGCRNAAFIYVLSLKVTNAGYLIYETHNSINCTCLYTKYKLISANKRF